MMLNINKPIKKLLLLHITLLITMLLIAVMACTPALPLEVENQTDQGLTIYVQSVEVFKVAPGETAKEYTAPMINRNYFIEGIDKSGEIIYSEIISWDKLRDNDWKIVITSSQENPYFPLEIENETNHLLYIYLNSTPIGNVEPGARMKKRPLSSEYTTYVIEAESFIINDGANRIVTVYSKTFTRDNLEEMNWRITIPSPENE